MQEIEETTGPDVLGALKAASIQKVGIVCHKNADPDSFCSAYALSLLLEHLGIQSEVIAPEGLNEVAKHLLPSYGLKVYPSEAARGVEAIITVDVCSLDQLGELAEIVKGLARPVFLIDHHAETAGLSELARMKFVDERAVSVGELVYRLYEGAGVIPSQQAAKAMLAAIVYDSRHLMRATPRTLRIVLGLLETGIAYSDVVQSLHVPIDVSERIARLKAGQRLGFERIDDYLVAITHVGSFEASAARALLDLGADVAVVVGGDKEELRISARARDEFYAGTRIHLGRDILEGLGKQLGGGGGGHPTAAGASGTGDPEKVMLECGRLLRDAINASSTRK
jgi:bifunctional oligoribonuclease and PAP phosphatase NrnA